MIHRAKFQNFKALRDVEVTFDSRLTVLVGPNGSGKSSVLRGLEILCRILDTKTPADNVFSGSPRLGDLFGGDEKHAMLLEAAEEAKPGAWNGIQLTANISPRMWPGSNQPSLCSWRLYSVRDGARKEYLQGAQRPDDVLPSFYPAVLLQLQPTQLAQNSATQTVPPKMDAFGTGLPSVLAYLKLYDEERFDDVVTQFRHLIPNVKRVRIDRVQAGGNVLGEGLLFDLSTRTGVRASAMSDGTMYLLGLLTVICGPHRPKVLLLDDLDHGLHPKAQMELVTVLRQLIERYSELQVIATSHSPYILDKLQPSEVRVTALNDDGSVVCAPLAKHPLYERWKKSMSPGEFWSHGGEDWVKELKEPVAQ